MPESTTIETRRPRRKRATDEPLPADRVWVDDRDLARITPISRVRWQVMRRRGEGPRFFRLGGRVVYKRADVELWIESHAVEAR